MHHMRCMLPCCDGTWCNIVIVHSALFWWCYSAILRWCHSAKCNRGKHDWKDAMQCLTKQCHAKAISLQCNISQTKCSQVCAKTRQHKTWCWFLTGMERRVGSRVGWVKNERNLCQTQKKILGRRDGWRRVWSKKWKDSWPTGAKTVFYMRNFGTRCFSSYLIVIFVIFVWQSLSCVVLSSADKQNYQKIMKWWRRSQTHVLHEKLWNTLLHVSSKSHHHWTMIIFVQESSSQLFSWTAFNALNR